MPAPHKDWQPRTDGIRGYRDHIEREPRKGKEEPDEIFDYDTDDRPYDDEEEEDGE